MFHLAGVTFVPDAEREPTRAMRANYDATVYLMQALGELADSARVLHVSTSEVYGLPQRLPIDETHPVNPTNVYSISKAAADQFVRLPRGPNGPRVIVARPFNHSGPGQNASFVLSSFARQVARIELGLAEPVLRVGNLSAARDFLHVEDVVSAYLLLAEGGTTEDVYNICSGTSHTIQEAMEKLLSLSSMSIRWEVDPERWRESACQEIRGSHERLTRDTGWEPRVTFGDLLKDILEYWRQRERTEV